MKRCSAFILCLIFVLLCACAPAPSPAPAPDAGSSIPVQGTENEAAVSEIEARAREIMAEMSREEMVWQMIMVYPEQLLGRSFSDDPEEWDTALESIPAGGIFFASANMPSAEGLKKMLSVIKSEAETVPFLALDEGELRTFLQEAVPAGLDGMETMYPLFDEHTMRLAGEIADEFHLLHSGGSDFHGANKPDICLGTGRGNLHIPEQILTDLEN